MVLFLQVSSSLAPMQVCWRMLHCPAAKPRVATGQGREVFFPRHRCSVERTEYLMRFFCLVISIYIYIVIVLYSYILIYLYRYCVICLLCCLFIALLHAYSIGVLLSLYLYSIFAPYFDLYFFIIEVAVSLSSGFFPCKGMAVLSDTKHQAMPYSAKTFPESLPQMLHIWVFQKTFYRIVWCSDSWNHHLLMHVKRLYDDEMTE